VTTFVGDLWHADGGVSTLSNSFNVGAGDYLRVFVIAEGGVSLTSISFGAQTPTFIVGSGVTDILGAYEVVAPTTGSQVLTANLSGASGRCAFYAVSRSGVNQITPSGTPGTNSGSGTAVSATASSAVGELVEGICHVAQTTVTSAGGQTERENQADWLSAGRSFSAAEKAGAALVTLDWTIVTADWFALAIPVIPAAASASPVLGRRYFVMP
jgi:hypothetical protein